MSASKAMFTEMQEQEVNEQRMPVLAKRSIYNISNDHLLLMQQIEDAEGEITEEMSASLAINEKELQAKAVSYGYIMRQYDYDIEQINQEVARLNKLSQAKVKVKEELKSRISDAMKAYNIEKIDHANLKLSFRKSKVLVIDDNAHIPVEYIKTKEVETVDKAGIKKAIEEGTEYSSIWIHENQNLQIK